MPSRADRSPLLPAGLLLVLAAIAYFWSQDRPMLRLAPADFACWHEGLRSQAGLYADQPELLVLAESPVTALEAEVTLGRRVGVEGDDWARLFQQVPAVIGRDCSDLEGDLCSRVSPREADWVNGLFFSPEEPPFAGLAFPNERGPASYLYLRDDPGAQPLQLLQIPAGRREGKVQGCRWYYSSWELPTRFVHPWRRYTTWLVGLGLMILFWRPLGRAAASLGDRGGIWDPRLINFRKRSARISLGVTAVMLALFVGALVPDPQADYVPPLVFVGGFLLLMAIITTGILWRSALRQDRILVGEELLAQWEYAPSEWHRQVETLFRERRAASRTMLLVVGVIMLIVGGLFVLAMGDEASLFVAAVLLGVFVLLVLVAVIAPARQRRFLLSRPGLVLIARSGVYLAGEFHDFRVFGSRLEGAEVQQLQDAGRLLRIRYSFENRSSRQSAAVSIPVPPGKETEAEKVAAELNRTAGGH